MKYKYSVVSGQSDIDGSATKRPVVWLEVSNGKHTRSYLALIDSGSDHITMSSKIVEIFGIERPGREARPLWGISMEPTGGFVGELTFKLEHQQSAFTAPVVFLDSNVPVLLGREGFFDRHRIKFEQDHDTFEITPSPR